MVLEREEKERREKQVEELKKEIEEMARAQTSMELRLEDERKTAMEVRRFDNNSMRQ